MAFWILKIEQQEGEVVEEEMKEVNKVTYKWFLGFRVQRGFQLCRIKKMQLVTAVKLEPQHIS